MSTTAVAAATTTWKIDPSHSHIGFSVRHLMISTVKGRFAAVDGRVTVNETDLAASAVDVNIDASSIDTRDAQRDAHLRSADFFDVERFPSLTFKSTRVTPKRGSAFAVTGDLTIHGVTREVTLEVTEEGRGKDPWGGERFGFSAVTTIKRSDFGLTWNQALEAGGVLVGDDVKVTLELELLKG
jgi:polyisoprenoid-binding protein YceI